MIIEATIAQKKNPEASWTETFEVNPDQIDSPRQFVEEKVRQFNDSPWTREREMIDPDELPGLLGGFMKASYKRTYNLHGGKRPASPERVLKSLETRREGESPHHKWLKASTMMEGGQGGSTFDWYVCRRCYVVGRAGVTGDVELEAPYRKAKVYHHCDRAKRHLQEHGHPSGLSKGALRARRFVRQSSLQAQG